jgi:hypothetical protein
VIAAVRDSDQYLRHVKNAHVDQGERERPEMQREVVRALLKVVKAICGAAELSGEEDSMNGAGRVMLPSLRALFALSAATMPDSDGCRHVIQREILGPIFDSTVYTPHLAPLFSHPRRKNQEPLIANRASHFKGPPA